MMIIYHPIVTSILKVGTIYIVMPSVSNMLKVLIALFANSKKELFGYMHLYELRIVQIDALMKYEVLAIMIYNIQWQSRSLESAIWI